MSTFNGDIVNLTNLGVTDVAGNGPGAGTGLNPGDLRRKFNFGDRVSELAIAQEPFFRFVSKVSKKPTDDPGFKWAEKTPSWNKRYGYVCGYINSSGATVTNNAILHASNDGGTGADLTGGTMGQILMMGNTGAEWAPSPGATAGLIIVSDGSGGWHWKSMADSHNHDDVYLNLDLL